MTRLTDPLFDQRIADWLEDDPDHAPAPTLDIVLAAVPSIRQRRTASWRFPTMTMPLRLATAALIGALVLGGAFILSGGGSRPSTSAPTATPGPVWTVTGSPSLDRGNARVATQLMDGRVLYAGGSQAATAELYDPTTGTWASTGTLSVGRAYPISARLADGKILVAGGSDVDGSSTELFDPTKGVWTRTGDLVEPRGQGFGITLADGRVLAAGGGNDGGKSTAELFDPATGRWSSTGSMTMVRAGPLGITRLTDGRILVTGGFADDKTSAEIYDPSTGRWTATTGRMTAGRSDEQSAIALRDGRVLVCGGFPSSCDLFDPSKGTFAATGTLKWNYRDLLVLNQLANGSVLLVAGDGDTAADRATAELFDPATSTWTAVKEPMSQVKYVRSAHVLPDGTVLVVGSDSTIPGGTGNNGGTPSVEVYHPAP